MNKGLIIDWMDGRHLDFKTFEEAEKEYDELLKSALKNDEEFDMQLLEVKKEFNSVD